jgi:hypothetical protein
MNTKKQNNRRDFLKSISLVCVSIAAPTLIFDSRANAASPAPARILTKVTIEAGEIADKEQIEKVLKSITGVHSFKYYPNYNWAILQYIPEQKPLPEIVQLARENGVNVQRLHCIKKAPYCDKNCPACPAKKHEF